MEVEEKLVLSGSGEGSYSLAVRYDEGLLARLHALLGPTPFDRLGGHELPPLAGAALALSLRGLGTLTDVEAEDERLAGGWRRVAVRCRFKRLPDLLEWEPFRRRAWRLVPASEEAAAAGGAVHRLHVAPYERLPLLDPAAAWLAMPPLPDAATPPATAPVGPREPSLAERLGLEPRTLSLLRDVLAPRLAEVQLAFSVEFEGRVVDVEGERTTQEAQAASLRLEGGDLLAPGVSRRLAVTWAASTLDLLEPLENAGAPAWGAADLGAVVRDR